MSKLRSEMERLFSLFSRLGAFNESGVIPTNRTRTQNILYGTGSQKPRLVPILMSLITLFV